MVDLTGQVFNRLTVLKLDTERKSKNKYWICQCNCGIIKSIQQSNLTSGLTQSCGCLHKEKVSHNLIGQKFGKLTVIKDTGKRTNGRNIIWECQCDCGKIIEVPTNNLKQNNTMSCGCMKQSHGEYFIENILKINNIKYKKEYVFLDLLSPKNGSLRFDFAILDDQNNVKKLIEYDGETHSMSYIGGWNTKEKIEYQQLCDKLKDNYCKIHGIPLLRISYLNKENDELERLILQGD